MTSLTAAAAAARDSAAAIARFPWHKPEDVAARLAQADRLDRVAARWPDIPAALLERFGAAHLAYLLDSPNVAGAVSSRQRGAWDCNDPDGFADYGRLLDYVNREPATVTATRGQGWAFYPR